MPKQTDPHFLKNALARGALVTALVSGCKTSVPADDDSTPHSPGTELEIKDTRSAVSADPRDALSQSIAMAEAFYEGQNFDEWRGKADITPKGWNKDYSVLKELERARREIDFHNLPAMQRILTGLSEKFNAFMVERYLPPGIRKQAAHLHYAIHASLEQVEELIESPTRQVQKNSQAISR